MTTERIGVHLMRGLMIVLVAILLGGCGALSSAVAADARPTVVDPKGYKFPCFRDNYGVPTCNVNRMRMPVSNADTTLGMLNTFSRDCVDVRYYEVQGDALVRVKLIEGGGKGSEFIIRQEFTRSADFQIKGFPGVFVRVGSAITIDVKIVSLEGALQFANWTDLGLKISGKKVQVSATIDVNGFKGSRLNAIDWPKGVVVDKDGLEKMMAWFDSASGSIRNWKETDKDGSLDPVVLQVSGPTVDESLAIKVVDEVIAKKYGIDFKSSPHPAFAPQIGELILVSVQDELIVLTMA